MSIVKLLIMLLLVTFFLGASLQVSSACCDDLATSNNQLISFQDAITEYDLRFPDVINTFYEEISSPKSLGMFGDYDLLVDDLSEAELMLTRTYYLEEYPWFPIFVCGGSLGETLTFLMKYGRMPTDGMDMMLTMRPSWTSEAGLARLNTIAAGDLKTIMADSSIWKSVNPATGKLYESFDNPNWHSLGVYAEEVTEPEMIPSALWSEEEQKYVSGMFPHKMVRIVVFGETPGRVLVDKKIGLMLDDFTAKLKPCKCKPE